MNQDWTSFLENNGAQFLDNGEAVFPTDNSDNIGGDCQKIPLTHLGVIRVSGADKQTFLQGQLTNDTRNLDAERSQLSSYCTVKGRMLASFRIVPDGDDWLMLMPQERVATILKRLSMFVLRADVTLKDASDELAIVGLVGDCIAELEALNLPAKRDGVTHNDGINLVKVDDQASRYLAVGDVEAVQSLWLKLDAAAAASTINWRLQDIRAGIPSVVESTVEAFIPQMTNLQLINGVSFTKGCYTGQEVVARMQYLGKLKRRMYPVSFSSDIKPQPGDELFSSASKSGQGAGRLVDVVATSEGHYEALAVLEIEHLENATFQLHDSNGPVIEINDPPYPFESDDNAGEGDPAS